MRRRIIFELTVGLITALFAYTALNKFFGHDLFIAQLQFYPLLRKAPEFFSWFVPISELLVVLLLVIPLTRKWGLWAALWLLFVFTTYLLYMVITKSNLPCSCGGVLEYMTWKEHIIFNGAFILLCITAIKMVTHPLNKTVG